MTHSKHDYLALAAVTALLVWVAGVLIWDLLT
jgi:hypothetical protein